MLKFIFFINIFFQIYTIMLFVRILASWIPQVTEYRAFHFLTFYTDPYLNLFRKIIPPLGMIDISPIVALLCLNFLQDILIHFLAKLV